MKYELHQFCTAFRRANEREQAELVTNMKSHGYDKTQPITLYEGTILDGSLRQDAAEEAGVEPTYRLFEGSEDEAMLFVIRHNKVRKHMTRGELDLAVAQLVTAKRGGRSGQHINSSGGRIDVPDVKTRVDAAKEAGITLSNVDKARELLRHADDSIIAMVKAGEISSCSVAADGIRGKNKAEQAKMTAAEVRKISNDYKRSKEIAKPKQPTWGRRVPLVKFSKLDIGTERIDGQPVLLQPAHVQRLTEASIRVRATAGRVEGFATMDVKAFEDDIKKLLDYEPVSHKKNGEERAYANDARRVLVTIVQHISEARSRLAALDKAVANPHESCVST